MSNIIKAKLDPLGHSPGVPGSKFADACGVLPIWIIEAMKEFDSVEDVTESVLSAYALPCSKAYGGIISEKGIYLYPEDLPLYPLMEIKTDKVRVLIYHYALIAFQSIDDHGRHSTHFMTRMD
jgi:hypothetical protein